MTHEHWCCFFLGPYVNEVWQTFRNNYASHTLRVFTSNSSDSANIESISDIGPLDKGRELVTRLYTSLQTATSATTGLFYTDDNGLEMLVRDGVRIPGVISIACIGGVVM